MAKRDLSGAIEAMESIGYEKVRSLGILGDAGTVYTATKNGESLRLKISCHSCKQSRPRYLVQIWVNALKKVDRFVFWFENETYFYDIPAKWLNKIFDENRFVVRVAHNQWQINLDIEQGGFEIAADHCWDFRKYQESHGEYGS